MNDVDRLRSVARWLGRLLLHEVDRKFLERLRAPEMAALLAEWEIEVPEPTDEAVNELAAQYFETILQPVDAPPPVQSVCEEGSFQGEAAVHVQKVAEAAGVEFDATAARGAPMDHLGVQLLLWEEIAGRDPVAAHQFWDEHLKWGVSWLERVQQEKGFYGRIAAVAADFIRDVMPTISEEELKQEPRNPGKEEEK